MTTAAVTNTPQTQTKLTREQKEAVGLLSIGTFLEYFDLMIYVHMAVLLNELFFPKTDPHTVAILAAVTFCTTYVFRPFGALLFGWIGDNIGRRTTIIVTTGMMAICCATMAVLPTYAEIGITAAYLMIGCRILQGMSSMGEVVGALLYLTEFVKIPARYPAVAMIPLACTIGTVFALGLAAFVTSLGISWRVVFGFGALIAVIGIMARTTLRESPEFADAVKRMKNIKQDHDLDRNAHPIMADNDKVNKKTALSLFLMECMWPLCFYFVYIHCSQVLQNNCGYSAEDVIKHNFFIGLIELAATFISVFACYKMHPLIFMKYLIVINVFVFLVSPVFLNNANALIIGTLQSLIVVFAADSKFATSAIYTHFPVFKRFKSAAFLYALSRALTYVVVSFGMVYLLDWFGNWGVLIAMLTVSIGSAYGLRHFLNLERQKGNLSIYHATNAVQKPLMDADMVVA